MADESDAVFYTSSASSNRGGSITTTKVLTNKNQNFFASCDPAQALLGSDRFRCFYIKNDHPTETIRSVVLYIDSNTISEDDEIQIGLEPGQEPHIKLDGSDDYIQCGSETGLWSQGLTKFSFSIWLYPTKAGDGFYRGIVRHGSGAHYFELYLDETDPTTFNFVIRDAADVQHWVSVGGLVLNQWQHVVCTYDNSLGSANIKIYRNKVVGSITADLTETITDTGNMTIANDGTTDEFAGYVKDFRWWTTKALTQTELNNVYDNNTSAPAPNYWLKMDEGTGNPVDSISGTKTGTLNNGASWSTVPSFIIAQTIAAVDVEPSGVEWTLAETHNQGLFVAKELKPGEWRAVWMWRHVTPTQQDAKNRAEFIIAFDPPPGSTGTGSGSGSGTSGGGGDSPTPSPAVSNFAIAITGDWSLSSDAQDTVENILNFPDIELTVSVGDNSYTDSGDKWASITKKLREDGREMKTVFGNHERKEGTPQPELTNFYLSLMNQENTYFDFTFKNFYFVVIDNYKSWDIGSTQYNWVKDKMQKSKNNSAITWRVLLFHEPMYTSPSHYDTDTKFAKAYHPLMIANDFDFGFNGHNHNYMRTYPLTYNSGNPGSPTKVDSSQEPNYSSPGGQIFAQVGTAGRSSHRSFDGTSSFSAKQQDSYYGFLKLAISNSGRQVTAQFYKNNGQVYEKFTVVK